MKPRWVFLLLLPLFMTGCLWLPTTEPHKQTVHKGTPPPVDPKLPGSKVASQASAPGNNQPKDATMADLMPAPITAGQVNPANAYEMGQNLHEEMTRDTQNLASPSGGKGKMATLAKITGPAMDLVRAGRWRGTGPAHFFFSPSFHVTGTIFLADSWA